MNDTLNLDPSVSLVSIFSSELMVATARGIELSSTMVTFGDSSASFHKKKTIKRKG